MHRQASAVHIPDAQLHKTQCLCPAPQYWRTFFQVCNLGHQAGSPFMCFRAASPLLSLAFLDYCTGLQRSAESSAWYAVSTQERLTNPLPPLRFGLCLNVNVDLIFTPSGDVSEHENCLAGTADLRECNYRLKDPEQVCRVDEDVPGPAPQLWHLHFVLPWRLLPVHGGG